MVPSRKKVLKYGTPKPKFPKSRLQRLARGKVHDVVVGPPSPTPGISGVRVAGVGCRTLEFPVLFRDKIGL